MYKQDKHRHDALKDPRIFSLDSSNFSRNRRKPQLSFERYKTTILEYREKDTDSLDYVSERAEDERIDAFLNKHSGLSYHDFIEMSNPEDIEEDSYGLIKRKSIKRSLFKSRSRLYLGALCDFEEQGGDISKVLDDIRFGNVPLVKKSEGKEATFEAIFKVLKK